MFEKWLEFLKCSHFLYMLQLNKSFSRQVIVIVGYFRCQIQQLTEKQTSFFSLLLSEGTRHMIIFLMIFQNFNDWNVSLLTLQNVIFRGLSTIIFPKKYLSALMSIHRSPIVCPSTSILISVPISRKNLFFGLDSRTLYPVPPKNFLDWIAAPSIIIFTHPLIPGPPVERLSRWYLRSWFFLIYIKLIQVQEL